MFFKISDTPIEDIKKLTQSLEIKEDGHFDIDISRGLYIGAGVSIASEDEENDSTVKGIFINWGDLRGHLSVYGTTRVGKTRLMVSLIRQCILRGMDILVVEPKGAVGKKVDEENKDLFVGQETFSWVMQFAEEAGRLRDIRYISPKFHEMSSKFNPLYALTNEEIASLVATIIPSDDEFFAVIGRQITMAILLGLEFLEQIEGEEVIQQIISAEYKKVFGTGSNIVNAKLALSNPDLAERVINVNSTDSLDTVSPPYRSLVTFADLATYATQEGVQAILQFVKKHDRNSYSGFGNKKIMELERMREEAFKALSEMAEKDKQYYSKVSTTFNTVLQQMSTGDLGRILCSVKINPLLDRFFSERGQIIIIQPWPLIYKDASKSFVRIFFAVITSYLGNIGASGRALRREIAMFIDEGGAVLYAGVEDLFNKAGGLGLNIFIFTQSFADYSSGLGEEVAKIVNDNTNIKIYMRMNDQASREQVQASFGTMKKKTTKYMGSKIDMRISSDNTEVDIMSPAHIGNMQKQEFLLQYGEGRFYCVAPTQDEPSLAIEMPDVHMERSIKKFSKKFQPEVIS